MEQTAASVLDALQATMSHLHTIRRPAEKFLESVEGNQGYPLLLLQLIDKQDLDVNIRVAGAIVFKNYVKRNWPVEEEGVDNIHSSDRDGVRNALVGLMLKSPPLIQKQLSDAVAIVGKQDFPDKWPGLLSEMVEKFNTGDFHLINGVLQTAHSIFKRYRYEFKSNKLWTEIKFVLDNFAKPLTDLFTITLDLRNTLANNPEGLKVIYSSILLICKIFHSLNYQDLPEFFEDNMNIWMPKLLELLQIKVPILQTTDDDEPSVIEKVRREAIECAALYALKYSEEFAPHAAAFVTAAWNALVDAGPQTKYDELVTGAIGFLSNVAEKLFYRKLFEDPDTLSNICEKVIIPNIEFRESDQELFEDNPEEYIRRDIEGSDVETRRRAACDFVRVLSVTFEAKIFQIFGQYIQAMLTRHTSAPDGSQWRSKDAALYLVTSLLERGRTEKTGVTSASSLVNLPVFCQENVIPDLNTDINSIPVLKADAIKYIMAFRSLLPKEQIVAVIPQIMRHLDAESIVVASYSACCLEKLVHLVGKNDQLAAQAPTILHGLMVLMQKPAHKENDYAMRAVMRILAIQQESCLPALGALLPHLASTLSIVTKNPSRPHFNHYMFESLSLCIKIVCKNNPGVVDSFEDALFPVFEIILQQEVIEFMPYVFQMLSLLLEQRMRAAGSTHSGDLGGPYVALVGCLLAPPLWQRPANVHPLVTLLCSLIAAAHGQLLKDDRLGGLLGVFQKLNSSKMNDHEGFVLIRCILLHFPESAMRPFLKQVLSLLFQRLTSAKTTKYIKGLIPFLGFYTVKYGPVDLVETLDSIQPSLFGMYCERIMIPELQKVSEAIPKKCAASGCIRLLCECPYLRDPSQKYHCFWAPIMQALLSLLELPSDDTTNPDDWIDIDEPAEYQAAYCQLNSARQAVVDPLADVPESRLYLSQSLGNLSRTLPGQLPSLVQTLPPDHRTVLENYLKNFNIQIA